MDIFDQEKNPPPPFFLWNFIDSWENKTKQRDRNKTKQIHVKFIATII